MEKPVPKHEIVIKNMYKESSDAHNPHCKVITTYSDDAWRWIQQEAPSFGKLVAPSDTKMMEALARMTARIAQEKGNEEINLPEFLDGLKQSPGVQRIELRIDECYDPAEVVKYLVEGYASTPPRVILSRCKGIKKAPGAPRRFRFNYSVVSSSAARPSTVQYPPAALYRASA